MFENIFVIGQLLSADDTRTPFLSWHCRPIGQLLAVLCMRVIRIVGNVVAKSESETANCSGWQHWSADRRLVLRWRWTLEHWGCRPTFFSCIRIRLSILFSTIFLQTAVSINPIACMNFDDWRLVKRGYNNALIRPNRWYGFFQNALFFAFLH